MGRREKSKLKENHGKCFKLKKTSALLQKVRLLLKDTDGRWGKSHNLQILKNNRKKPF
jgi:hypothetical protein